MRESNFHDHKPANAPSAVLARAEQILMAGAGLAMIVIMGIVVLDVVMRYVFSSPLSWPYTLIGHYLMAALFFLALSDTMQHHGHIALDVFLPILPRRLRNMMQASGFGISSSLVAFIAYLGIEQAILAWSRDERFADSLALPSWVPYALLSVGMGLLSIRCAYRAVYFFASIFSQRDLVELPPSPTKEAHTGEHGE
ncbi:TRAP transporter small permease [Marinobacterium sp. MBR-109]|jgi:TRAP-type C4-dicarboxylate transport system permease small subunit|uniref:TRAP transporter small permease n=1 Tax=Marinobacterium sp. MBR-109 TaxID=3156462 RepID=UPI003390B8DF